ncbi:MAG TPA: single-stranded DNA-binding protein [Actinomycetes bacterium]|nr:single-stranded DNA-binding protein [Actinomycetes bacterium]
MPKPPTADQPTTVDVNAVILTGYLARAADLYTTRQRVRMVFLRLAFHRSASQFDYVDVLVADQHADHASRLRQGQRVLVLGRLQQHRWKARAGATRCKHAIVEPLTTPTNTPDPAPRSSTS